MDLNKRPLNVADEAVDAAIESLRKEHTELRPIEGREVSASTDVLSIKLVGWIGEHQLDRDSMPVDLEDPNNEPLPGLIAALTGIPLDAADHEVSLTIPEDFHEKSIAGVTSTLTVSVLDARQKEVPELDDDFAKDTGKGETVDELRATLRKQLEDAQADDIKRELRDAALIELVKRNQIPVASALVDRAVDLQINRFRSMLGIPKGGSGSDAEFGLTGELRDKMRPRAVDEVRGQLLLEAIADKEEISVTDEDIDAHLLDLAASRGMPLARLRADRIAAMIGS
jgi:trigger factor